MDEDRFQYIEQDPPLRGKDRRKDMCRQRINWLYHNDPVYRAAMKIRSKLAQMERVASGEAAAYQRRRKAAKLERIAAVARKCGATLAIAVGLLLPAAAHADPVTVQIPVQCGPLVELEALIVRHGEKLLLAGTDGDLGTLFFWTNFDTGTWTVVRKIDDESGCIMMSGGALQPIPQSIIPLPGEPV